jgi:hypothetical protein
MKGEGNNMRRALIAVAMSLALAAAGAASQTELQKEAKISMDKARSIALKRVPGGTVQSAELEREGGKLIYSFDIKGKKGITEVNVDAANGKVVAVHHESAAKEAAEKKKEAEKKKN